MSPPPSPLLRVADCPYNAEQSRLLMQGAEEEGVALARLPGAGPDRLHLRRSVPARRLQRGALDALEQLTQASGSLSSGVAVVGLPLAVDDQVFNCAAVLHRGQHARPRAEIVHPQLQGVLRGPLVRRRRHRAQPRNPAFSANRSRSAQTAFLAPWTSKGLTLGVEICEDLWVPVPPSSTQALAGATVLVNLSASNEVIGKSGYRRQLVVNQSGRCMAAYVYASCGV